MFRKRHWVQPEFNNGIRGQGLKQELCLGSKKAREVLGQTIVLEIAKRAVEFSTVLRKISIKISLRNRPPSK
jgi:hypothetical protein